MVGPKSYLAIEPDSVTDRTGRIHCWSCGTFLAAIRRRGDHPTYLCAPCYQEFSKLREREAERSKRLREGVRTGRFSARSGAHPLLRPSRRN
ncbi:MAG: hypothetical protein L3K09_01960 [Thermoplasmata archaeon]|nr:hypothetical protein [Thermoplasmata archaeon]